VLIAGLLVIASMAGGTVASAEPLVSLEPAQDGTLVVVGTGWRPGLTLVVSAGADVFAATTDAVGDFEVQTGLPASGGTDVPLAVRRPAAPDRLAPASVTTFVGSSEPHPLAVLYVGALANGALLLAASLAGLAMATVGLRRLGGVLRPLRPTVG
jgi:hypothetical protein